MMKRGTAEASSGYAPLDDNVVTEFDPIESAHRQLEAELPSLFNQLTNRGPARTPEVVVRKPAGATGAPNGGGGSSWREVSGDWRNQLNPASGYGSNTDQTAAQSAWNTGDQLDVPLLNAAWDDSQRNTESWEDHCHRNTVMEENQAKARFQLISASILCILFMIAEAVGGYFANSLAIMTDAAHMLSDFISFIVSLLAIWVSQRPATRKMSFGYHRAEILGALLSILIIWVLTGVLIYMAVDRVVHPNYTIDADAMIIVSGIGVLMNIAMGAVLHGGFCCKQLGTVYHGHSHGGSSSHGHSHGTGSSHGHSHGSSHGHSHGSSHGHSHSEKSQNQSTNLNVRAAFIHVIGDLVQSIGVLIAAIIIKFRPDYKLADPICTFLFSVLVLATTFGLIRDTVHVLMEGVPRNVDYRQLRADLKDLAGVQAVHSLHIWALTMERCALAVHLAIDSTTDPQLVLNTATRMLQNKYDIAHCTVQVERYQGATMELCAQCTALSD